VAQLRDRAEQLGQRLYEFGDAAWVEGILMDGEDSRPAVKFDRFGTRPIFASEDVRKALRSERIAGRFEQGLKAGEEAVLGGEGKVDGVERRSVRMGMICGIRKCERASRI
jgi:hypothetical protein